MSNARLYFVRVFGLLASKSLDYAASNHILTSLSVPLEKQTCNS